MKVKEVSTQVYSIREGSETPKVACKRILVVDTEDPLREALVTMLTRYGHKVDSTGEGTTAYEKLLANTYDLIITDFRVPTKGIGFVEKIKQIRPQTRVILLLGWDEGAFSDGHHADSFLTKPVTIRDLLETVYLLFPEDTSSEART
jgi:DNA-binding response OmpR family regulator